MSAGTVRGGTTWRVRPAALDDVDGLVELCREHARYERAEFDPCGAVDRLRDAIFSRPVRLHAWVAASGDGLTGYATATAEFSTWDAREYLHMDCLFVREGRRNAGVGAALMAAVVAHARKYRLAEIQWQTPIWNEGAARFYRRKGTVEHIKRRYFLDTDITSQHL
ncbi:MAG: GNAT family N-acetyltransferase [Xanthomonadales bacterium]|nr:GNAT family N-acetyltransferase [Xanthomonadales bacterium]